MDITLYEEVNIEKLEEVIECNNILLKEDDDLEWFNTFKKNLKKYKNKKKNHKGYEVKYTQKNKFGRYISDGGLQNFQRDVRKYISGEFVRDFDFENCHPVLLEQVFKKNNLYGGQFLEEYNKDKKKVMLENNIKDKLVLIKVINSEDAPNKEIFKELHNNVYSKLLPVLLKEESNKNLLKRIKKERNQKNKPYNYNGAFMSHYLQNIENNLLMSFYKYLNEKFIRVHTLMFDGLTIDKESGEVDINGAQERIYDDTGFNIKIVEKSMKTDWVPLIEDDIDLHGDNDDVYKQKFSREYLDKLVEKEEESKTIVEYLNNFMCKFEEPFSTFGFRYRKEERFQIIKNKGDLTTEIGGEAFKMFIKSDSRLQYLKQVFIVNDKDPILQQNVYNVYIRPKYIVCSEEELKEKVPLLFDFLKRIISNNDENVYIYLINYISLMVCEGQTKQSIVLKGKKGIGKTVFGDVLKVIIENVKDEYSQNVNDINMMTSKFNSLSAQCIITTIEEVVNDAGSYHSVQNKLKDLITSETIRLEKKGIDPVMINSQNNLLIFTNNMNPVEITKDNRRYLVLKVNETELGNGVYFHNVKKQVKENVEYIRGYFYAYKYQKDLNNIRPTTAAEIELRELNKSMDDEFIDEELVLEGDEKDDSRCLDYVYDVYKRFCLNNGKKSLSKPYFSMKLGEKGYTTKRLSKDGERKRYIQDKE